MHVSGFHDWNKQSISRIFYLNNVKEMLKKKKKYINELITKILFLQVTKIFGRLKELFCTTTVKIHKNCIKQLRKAVSCSKRNTSHLSKKYTKRSNSAKAMELS